MTFHSRRAFASTSILAIGLSTGGISPVPFLAARHAAAAVASTVRPAAVYVPSAPVAPVAAPVDTIAETVAETIIPVAGPASARIVRDDFTRAVTIASLAVERRNSIPILSNVMIKGDGQALTVTGTDMDLEISVTVPSTDAHLDTTLPADLLQKLLKKAVGSDMVSVIDGDGKAKLDFQRVKFDLQTLPSDDFPMMDLGKVSNEFTMTGRDFFTMIDRTADAISTEETRYYLNGIFMHVLASGNRTSLVAVATDGHRLYRQEFEMPFGADAMQGFIIPRKMVLTLRKLMKGKACPASVTVQVSGCKIRVSFDDVVVTSKLIDGTFPDYQRVIPAWNDKRASVSARAMLEGLESVSLISSERGRAVKLELSAGRCRLVVNNPESGSAVMDVDCLYDGDDLEIGFNAAYLVNLLKDAAAEADGVTMDFRDAGSPVRVTCGRDGWDSVLMPMRV